ncbi:lactoylglutathione lyase [Pandoraea terrae]|uniref:Lactoylglutathione lyase n=1 Tax=Pandoraea terrae TaxID=1537710 RepID=A0A5E4Z530_9BURK|nr:VOC family protein [Pandoraea terrae]VVE56189.1 lactoylglutathione lyase [Pandoraea terrae]
MKVPIVGLDHVVLRTADAGRLVRFYTEVLGCTIERTQEALGLWQLRAGNALIDITDVNGQIGRMGGPAPRRDGHNLDHFCLRVDPWDPDAMRAAFAIRGVSLGETAMRYGAEGEGPSCYLQDPDGNTVELKGPPAK